VLITDLHMPNAGDGFTVISAMRHSQPNALTMLLSAFPDVKSAMEATITHVVELPNFVRRRGRVTNAFRDADECFSDEVVVGMKMPTLPRIAFGCIGVMASWGLNSRRDGTAESSWATIS
jgi:hypothetical protein